MPVPGKGEAAGRQERTGRKRTARPQEPSRPLSLGLRSAPTSQGEREPGADVVSASAPAPAWVLRVPEGTVTFAPLVRGRGSSSEAGGPPPAQKPLQPPQRAVVVGGLWTRRPGPCPHSLPSALALLRWCGMFAIRPGSAAASAADGGEEGAGGGGGGPARLRQAAGLPLGFREAPWSGRRLPPPGPQPTAPSLKVQQSMGDTVFVTDDHRLEEAAPALMSSGETEAKSLV